jgi:hypothetical protein
MLEVGGVIEPPDFVSAFHVANRGASLDHPESGTVYVVMHSLRGGGVAPGNYLIDVATGAATVAVGEAIGVDGLSYVVDETAIILKPDLPWVTEVWANTPGRLIVITCLQRPDGSPSESNLVITAHQA